MAARLSPKHDELTRAKIKTSQLLNRLQQHVNGQCEMTSAQVQSAKILLDKTMPNLASVTLGSDPQNPPKLIVEHTFKSAI